MTKIIVLNGEKNTKKETIALRLANNSDVEYVVPYSTKDNPHFNYMRREDLLGKIKKDDPIMTTHLNGEIYVYFEEQFTADYCVVIADDFALIELLNCWNGDVITVRLVSDKSEKSERSNVYLYNHDFDIVFDVNNDDFNTLEAMIE